MSVTLFLPLILLVLMVTTSAFFSGSETTLFSLSRVRVEKLSEEKRGFGPLAARLLDHPLRLLVTIVIGNMFSNIFASALAAQVAIQAVGDAGLFLAIPLMTAVIVVFGEIIPKTFALYHNEFFARIVAPVLAFWATLVSPLRKLLGRFAERVLSGLGEYSQVEKARVTAQELRSAIPFIGSSGVLAKEETQLLHNIFRFRDRTVGDVMRPYAKLTAFDVNTPAQEIVKAVREQQFTRIPMFEDRPENVVGVLYVKDLLIHGVQLDQPVRRLLFRPPFFVPEAMDAGQLFRNMANGKTHMALVVNEYGLVTGFVTFEDLLEEIVGDIHDKDK
ncbi:MAG: DUF21 domain-containing protein [Candidatus Omnitrophica bacterium]|nr:DUF21 domain-containing protein [Candidatus Omnitrophota bacterium]